MWTEKNLGRVVNFIHFIRKYKTDLVELMSFTVFMHARLCIYTPSKPKALIIKSFLKNCHKLFFK